MARGSPTRRNAVSEVILTAPRRVGSKVLGHITYRLWSLCRLDLGCPFSLPTSGPITQMPHTQLRVCMSPREQHGVTKDTTTQHALGHEAPPSSPETAASFRSRITHSSCRSPWLRHYPVRAASASPKPHLDFCWPRVSSLFSSRRVTFLKLALTILIENTSETPHGLQAQSRHHYAATGSRGAGPSASVAVTTLTVQAVDMVAYV